MPGAPLPLDSGSAFHGLFVYKEDLRVQIMMVAYIAEFGVAFLFGAMALWALARAIRSDQFSDFSRSAASIFDDEEPVGRVTDSALAPAPRPSAGGGRKRVRERNKTGLRSLKGVKGGSACGE